MDAEDEFGDLYAGIDGSGDAKASHVSEQVSSDDFDIYGGLCDSGKTTFKRSEEEAEFDLYGGFANSNRKQDYASKPVGFSQIESSTKQMQQVQQQATLQAVPQQQQQQLQRPPPRSSGDSESDSDDDEDDLQIVLNNYNHRRPEAEQGTSGGEAKEAVEDVLPPSAASQAWTTSEEQVPPVQTEPQPPSVLVQQAPMGIPGIAPGILPPGLVPTDHALRPPGMPPPRPPRPLMQPQFKQYVRGPVPGHMNMNPGVRAFPQVRPGPRPWTGPPGFTHTEHHLPLTKSVFDMDLDAMEEKPWRHPNADITDYFNFGFNEVTWKAYCQHLNQARLKATMQNKISVYESGRSDLPIGKAIQVEGGVGERRASIDLRRNRNRDSNEVIEIVLREAEVETHYYGNDYDGSVTEEMADMFRMRNGPFMDGEGPFFPMGARPRGPYRMYPGGPYGGRGVMRPPFHDSGMPPVPIHMRPESFPVATGDFGDPSRKVVRSGEDEQSDASGAAKEDVRHSNDRRESGQKQEDDEKLDEKKTVSDKRPSDDDDHRSKHRSRKEGAEEHSKRPSEKDRSERPDKEKDRDQRKDEDWSKRSHQSRDEMRWKDDRKRRDEDRRREDDRRRDKGDEWQRREREDSWKRDREDSQKRKSSYESSKRYDKPSSEEEDYLRRKRKYKEYADSRQDDEYHDHRRTSSSRREREHSEDEERAYKDKHGWSNSKSKDDGRRNGSTSEYPDDRKKRKVGDYHVEKVTEEEEKRSRNVPSRTEAYGSDSSDNDEDSKHRKGRSKMERLNRERPPVTDEEEYVRQRQEGEPKSHANGSNKQEFLDSVARRKERFSKLESQERRPSEKEKPAQVDTAEFKHERPSRKRRWGS